MLLDFVYLYFYAPVLTGVKTQNSQKRVGELAHLKSADIFNNQVAQMQSNADLKMMLERNALGFKEDGVFQLFYIAFYDNRDEMQVHTLLVL